MNSKSQLKNLIHPFIEEVRMTLKNQTPRVVKIKAMKTYKPDVSHVTYQENPF